ncbi:hydrophobe/amphiphile efflux-1 (HAE1) family protein [Bradyrhizobium sp. USDA 4461]
MSISQGFIARPIGTVLLTLAVTCLGILAYVFLPVAALPQVEFPTIQITVSYPGADPETMGSSVATPLERQLAQISGVNQMTSVSGVGVTVITLQFDLEKNIDSAAQDVQAAITAAGGDLPKNLPTPPTYRKTNPTDIPILILAVSSDLLPITAVSDATENILAQQISQIDGVGLVSIAGVQKPAIRVQIDPAAIASRGISFEQIRTLLSSSTVNAPKGSVNGDRQALAISANDQLFTPDRFSSLVINYRNGAPVRIADVGRVVSDSESNRGEGTYNGKRAIILLVQKQPGANTIETVDRVKAALPKLQGSMPAGADLAIVTDRTQTIRASVEDVQFTMILTIVLVIFVVYLFLHSARVTFIPAVTVPLSLICTFGVMLLLGYSLDNLSLMGLTVAVGFVIDDAIVMVENIARHVEAGVSPIQAAVRGSREIAFTIVSMSVSLVAVFIPLLFMSGFIGRLFREFAATVAISIGTSAIISLTLTPMMCAFLIKQHKSKRTKISSFLERVHQSLLRGYEASLRWSLSHAWLLLGATIGTAALTGWLYVAVPKGFFPSQDTGLIVAVSEASQDISYLAMMDKHRELVQAIMADPAVDGVISAVGAGAVNSTVNNGRMFINLKPRSARDADASQVIQRLRKTLSSQQGIVLYMQAAQDINIGGRATRTQYQYTLQDANLGELETWSGRMLTALRRIAILQDVASDQQLFGPTLALDIDRDAAARFGITPQDIDDTLYDALGQRQVATMFTQLNQYKVILEATPEWQKSPDNLRELYLRSPITGQQVSMKEFARLSSAVQPLTVNHQGRFPAVTLSFNLAPGHALGDAVAAIQSVERAMGKPDSLVTSFQGNAQAFQAALATQPYLIAAAVLAIYVILGILYESAVHPITILSTLPSAGVGAILALMLGGYDLGVIGLIGIILLIGIVKKNAIMMVDFALEERRNHGSTPAEAIYRAALLRFRPIMMTTMAALLGAIPLAIGAGVGSEIRRPLGFAIVGGLLISQLLTLYTTPVIYLYLDRLSGLFSKRGRVSGREGSDELVTTTSPAE